LELFKKPFIHIILIAIIGLLAYSNTFNVPFQFDDISNIVENHAIKTPNNFWPPSGSRWLGFLTFALNYKFGSLDVAGYHIVNLTIHILNSILVYYLVVLTFRALLLQQTAQNVIARRPNTTDEAIPEIEIPHRAYSERDNEILRSNRPQNDIRKVVHNDARIIALFSSLIFVAHPIQTQAVTYIVQRFTSLATMFYLFSVVLYIKWKLITMQQSNRSVEQQTGKKNYCTSALLLYCASLISAILAMKTKEIAFTLPIIIFLYEFIFLEGKIKERLLYLIPVILTMLIIPLSIIGIEKPLGDVIGEMREATQETGLISRWSYLFTQFRVIVTYIRLIFLPINQNLDYDYPIYTSFFNPNVFLSFLFLLSIFCLGVFLLYRSQLKKVHRTTDQELPDLSHEPTAMSYERLIAFGIFWFFITHSVESSIIPIVDVIFEHRVYLPSVGAIIAFTLFGFYMLRVVVHKPQSPDSKIARLPLLLLPAIVIILLAATYQRNIVWKDKLSLWEDVAKKSPNKGRAYNNLGLAYDAGGRHNEALRAFITALKLDPENLEALGNLAVAYAKMGFLNEAKTFFGQILIRQPNDFKTHYALGKALDLLGDYDEAIKAYNKSLSLAPDFVDAHLGIGIIFLKQKKFESALKELQTADMLRPNSSEILFNIVAVYQAMGQNHEAKIVLDKFKQRFQLYSQ